MYSSSMLLRMKAMYFGWNFKYFPLIENVHMRMTLMFSNMISTLTIYSTAITAMSKCALARITLHLYINTVLINIFLEKHL